MNCPNYTNIRRQFLTPYFCRWPIAQKYETLMTTASPKMLSKFYIKYLVYAFETKDPT